VVFDKVEVVRPVDIRLMVRVGDRLVSVSPLRVLPGTTGAQTGDRGRLVLPGELVLNVGLVQ
jgi:hypothetical protein